MNYILTIKYIFEIDSKAIRQLNDHTEILVCYPKCSPQQTIITNLLIRLFTHYSICTVIKEPLLSFVRSIIIPLSFIIFFKTLALREAFYQRI